VDETEGELEMGIHVQNPAQARFIRHLSIDLKKGKQNNSSSRAGNVAGDGSDNDSIPY
jgi:hypothetical protein